MFTKINQNKSIRFFLIFIMTFLFLTNVFAYTTKDTLSSSTKKFANNSKINYIELNPYTNNPDKDVTVEAKKMVAVKLLLVLKDLFLMFMILVMVLNILIT